MVKSEKTNRFLIIRVSAQLCGLPLEHVGETMRPQPVRSIAGAPPFVVGLALVRGQSVPVIDAACLLGLPALHPQRFVTLKTGHHIVALAVEDVVGVRDIEDTSRHALPPLLAHVDEQIITGMASLDAELMVVLGAMRVLPDSVWSTIEADRDHSLA